MGGMLGIGIGGTFTGLHRVVRRMIIQRAK